MAKVGLAAKGETISSAACTEVNFASDLLSITQCPVLTRLCPHQVAIAEEKEDIRCEVCFDDIKKEDVSRLTTVGPCPHVCPVFLTSPCLSCVSYTASWLNPPPLVPSSDLLLLRSCSVRLLPRAGIASATTAGDTISTPRSKTGRYESF